MKLMTFHEAIVEARKSQEPNSHGYNAITNSEVGGVNVIFIHSDDYEAIYWETGSGEESYLTSTTSLRPRDLLHPSFSVMLTGAPEFREEPEEVSQ